MTAKILRKVNKGRGRLRRLRIWLREQPPPPPTPRNKSKIGKYRLKKCFSRRGSSKLEYQKRNKKVRADWRGC